MFLNGVFGVGINRIDPEEERDPPSEPTPLTFPAGESIATTPWPASTPPPNLQPLFSRVTKPIDISPHHVKALNIGIQPSCSPDDLLPLAPDGASYFPSEQADSLIGVVTYAAATKSDAVVAKRKKDFDDRLAELTIDNDTAFRIITKTPKPGTKPPRLAYMRKFWEALENMSQYWDSSLDQYYVTTTPERAPTETPKRPRLESASGHDGPPGAVMKPATPSVPNGTSTPNFINGLFSTPDRATSPERRPTRSTSASPEPRPTRRYKGRRMGNGSQMPDQFRVDAVRAFVEGAVWPFNAAVAPPRHMPVVQLGSLNVPVRQAAAVYRVPADRVRARQGFVEGPILGVQVRGETEFRASGLDAGGDPSARLDRLREIGGLLQLAQERAREGKTEIKPGEGRWWTSVPRWGGGPGGDEEETAGNGDGPLIIDGTGSLGTKGTGGDAIPSRMRRRKTPAMLWKELKCGTGFWDPRTEYCAIGKDPSSPYDEIFMVSSLNHHIAILKLTAHTTYTEYIRTNEVPHPPPEQDDWSCPQLQRTEWFDLFDTDQRIQAFKALWGIMAYMNREI